jgi:hypothetical protein
MLCSRSFFEKVLDGRDAVRHLGTRSVRQKHALGLRSVYEVSKSIFVIRYCTIYLYAFQLNFFVLLDLFYFWGAFLHYIRP